MSDDAKLLDRIAKLLRLATNNPSVEEARTAALQAAKLIVEHKFVVGREAPRPATPTPPRPPSNADIVELLRRQAAAQQAQAWQQHQAEAAQAAQREAWRQAARQDFAEELRKGGVTPDGGSWWRKVWFAP